MTTDYYLKQKGFSENGKVEMTFQELVKLMDDYKRKEIKQECSNLHHFTDIAHLGRCEECLQKNN